MAQRETWKFGNYGAVFLCVMMMLGFGVPQPARAEILPGQGSCTPLVAYNLAPALDWNPGMQFLNQMISARPWVGHADGQWGAMKFDELRASGYLDEAGWVRRIPPGLTGVGTSFAWRGMPEAARDRAGRYVLTYRGTGTLHFRGGARMVSQEPGRIVIDIAPRKSWQMVLTATDPAGRGDYIRDMALVAERHVPLFQAGALFNPDWVALIADARQLRFMDWAGTNNSMISSWDKRPRPGGPGLADGVPIETMVRLANEVGADPWFTMPHMADADYIRRFAEYVHDTLDSALTVRVEWSNEVWNTGFRQTHWARKQAEAAWGAPIQIDYTAKKAVETAQIWKEVFQDAPERLVTVLATQASNPRRTAWLLAPKMWQRQDPKGYVPPAEVFDELAVTTYFGGLLTRDATERTALLRALRGSPAQVNAYIMGRLRDPTLRLSIPAVRESLKQQKALAAGAGLKLVAYEGGQHLHQKIRKTVESSVLNKAEIDKMHAAMAAFVRSSDMAALYREIWDVWAGIGEGPFMQFTDIGRVGPAGSWGLRTALSDRPPRAVMLGKLAATSEAWWVGGAACGPHYRHGIVVQGTAAGERIFGTAQEDYLIGGPGADRFFPGPGDDGLNGGDGHDIAVFTGLHAQHSIQRDGDGYRITGPDGQDYLYNIETLEFSDASRVSLN